MEEKWRVPGQDPIDRWLDRLDAAFARLRQLDPAEVARAVRPAAGLGEAAVVALVARLSDRLALELDGAERSARALRALGCAIDDRPPPLSPTRRARARAAARPGHRTAG